MSFGCHKNRVHAVVAICGQARSNKVRLKANRRLQHVLLACVDLSSVVLHLVTVLTEY